MKLYELADNYKNLLDLLENDEVPQDLIDKALGEVEGQIEEKAENIAKVYKTLELEAKALKDEEQRIISRRKALENRTAGLKEYLDSTMKSLDIKKIKGNIFTLSIQKNPPSVSIENEEDIPEEYFVIKKEVAKKEILAALKEGKEVPGASMLQTESLRIR